MLSTIAPLSLGASSIAAHAGPWGGSYGPGFGPRWAAPGRAAESTLAERFAQGDIDEKEYRARLEVLRANNGFDDQARK